MTTNTARSLGVHPGVCHPCAECVPHGVGRHYRRQRLLVTLVEFLGKALKHGVIVDGHFRQAVPVQEQEISVPINLNGLCVSAVLQHSLERFIRGCAHKHLPKSAVRLGRFDIVAILCASQKLVVYPLNG